MSCISNSPYVGMFDSVGEIVVGTLNARNLNTKSEAKQLERAEIYSHAAGGIQDAKLAACTAAIVTCKSYCNSSDINPGNQSAEARRVREDLNFLNGKCAALSANAASFATSAAQLHLLAAQHRRARKALKDGDEITENTSTPFCEKDENKDTVLCKSPEDTDGDLVAPVTAGNPPSLNVGNIEEPPFPDNPPVNAEDELSSRGGLGGGQGTARAAGSVSAAGGGDDGGGNQQADSQNPGGQGVISTGPVGSFLKSPGNSAGGGGYYSPGKGRKYRNLANVPLTKKAREKNLKRRLNKLLGGGKAGSLRVIAGRERNIFDIINEGYDQQCKLGTMFECR